MKGECGKKPAQKIQGYRCPANRNMAEKKAEQLYTVQVVAASPYSPDVQIEEERLVTQETAEQLRKTLKNAGCTEYEWDDGIVKISTGASRHIELTPMPITEFSGLTKMITEAQNDRQQYKQECITKIQNLAIGSKTDSNTERDAEFTRRSRLVKAGFPGVLPENVCQTLLNITKHLENIGLTWTVEKTEKIVTPPGNGDVSPINRWPVTIKTTLPERDGVSEIEGPEITGFVARGGIYGGDDWAVLHIEYPETQQTTHALLEYNPKYRQRLANCMEDITKLTKMIRDAQDKSIKPAQEESAMPRAERQTYLGRGGVDGTNKIDTSRRVREDAKADNPQKHTAVKSADNPNR